MKITKPDITFSQLFSDNNHGFEPALDIPYEADTAHTLNDGQN